MLKEALFCLALNVYHEANVEPIEGKYAVAHVTLNRVAHNGYPDDICKVVYQRSQFSWTVANKRKPKGHGWQEAQEVAERVLEGEVPDITNGATHFHNNTVSPKWKYKMKKVARIGKHTFYKFRT